MGGLAELFSGSISMGLGAYLAAATDKEHYNAEEKREMEEIITKREDEEEETYSILAQYGISREALRPVVDALQQNPDMWVKVRKASVMATS
jgi:hypothetical protein